MELKATGATSSRRPRSYSLSRNPKNGIESVDRPNNPVNVGLGIAFKANSKNGIESRGLRHLVARVYADVQNSKNGIESTY